jgi:DNA-binding MarR family transcriptional regulator
MSSSTSPIPSEIADYEFCESVGYLLSRVRTNMWNIATQQTMVELGIPSTQASMLFMLARGTCFTAADLAREYGVDASAATRLVDRLEKRGLLSRVRSEADRRVVHLRVTEEGYALAARLPSIYKGVLDKLLVNFTAEEVGFLKSMLRRVLVNCDGEVSS